MTIEIFISVSFMMFDSSPDSILRELSKRDEENKNFDGFLVYSSIHSTMDKLSINFLLQPWEFK